MAYFNAVVRDKDNKLIAKTYLTDLTNVPWTWEVTYNHEEVFGSKLPEGVLCGPTRPIVITKRFRGEEETVPAKSYNILISTLFTDKKFRVKINSSHTVDDLRLMIDRRFNLSIDEDDGRLVLDSRVLHSGKANLLRLLQKAGHYTEQEDSYIATIAYVPSLRGGGVAGKQFSFVDMDGNQVSGTGAPATKEEGFKAYAKGLNLIGKCSNQRCISHSQRYLPKGKVMYNLGFRPFVRLTRWSCTFVCPACNDDGRGYMATFTPTNILVSGARAEIRYRKGDRIEVKTVLLEIESPKYVKFEDGDGDDNQVEYQWIEIYTVPLGKSLHDCVACGMEIHKVADEIKKTCGHAFHTDCLKRLKDCTICFTQITEESLLGKILSNCQVA